MNRARRAASGVGQRGPTSEAAPGGVPGSPPIKQRPAWGIGAHERGRARRGAGVPADHDCRAPHPRGQARRCEVAMRNL